MRIPRSASTSLVVALVALALIQLDAYRIRRDFERGVIARYPFAAEIPIVLPDAGPFRLMLQGNADADHIPTSITETTLRSPDDSSFIARYGGGDAARGIRTRADHRIPLATIERTPPGRYLVSFVATPPVARDRSGDDATALLLVRGARDAATVAPSPRRVLLLTTIMVMALMIAGIGVARAIRDSL